MPLSAETLETLRQTHRNLPAPMLEYFLNQFSMLNQNYVDNPPENEPTATRNGEGCLIGAHQHRMTDALLSAGYAYKNGWEVEYGFSRDMVKYQYWMLQAAQYPIPEPPVDASAEAQEAFEEQVDDILSAYNSLLNYFSSVRMQAISAQDFELADQLAEFECYWAEKIVEMSKLPQITFEMANNGNTLIGVYSILINKYSRGMGVTKDIPEALRLLSEAEALEPQVGSYAAIRGRIYARCLPDNRISRNEAEDAYVAAVQKDENPFALLRLWLEMEVGIDDGMNQVKPLLRERLGGVGTEAARAALIEKIQHFDYGNSSYGPALELEVGWLKRPENAAVLESLKDNTSRYSLTDHQREVLLTCFFLAMVYDHGLLNITQNTRKAQGFYRIVAPFNDYAAQRATALAQKHGEMDAYDVIGIVRKNQAAVKAAQHMAGRAQAIAEANRRAVAINAAEIQANREALTPLKEKEDIAQHLLAAQAGLSPNAKTFYEAASTALQGYFTGLLLKKGGFKLTKNGRKQTDMLRNLAEGLSKLVPGSDALVGLFSFALHAYEAKQNLKAGKAAKHQNASTLKLDELQTVTHLSVLLIAQRHATRFEQLQPNSISNAKEKNSVVGFFKQVVSEKVIEKGEIQAFSADIANDYQQAYMHLRNQRLPMTPDVAANFYAFHKGQLENYFRGSGTLVNGKNKAFKKRSKKNATALDNKLLELFTQDLTNPQSALYQHALGFHSEYRAVAQQLGSQYGNYRLLPIVFAYVNLFESYAGGAHKKWLGTHFANKKITACNGAKTTFQAIFSKAYHANPTSEAFAPKAIEAIGANVHNGVSNGIAYDDVAYASAPVVVERVSSETQSDTNPNTASDRSDSPTHSQGSRESFTPPL